MFEDGTFSTLRALAVLVTTNCALSAPNKAVGPAVTITVEVVFEYVPFTDVIEVGLGIIEVRLVPVPAPGI